VNLVSSYPVFYIISAKDLVVVSVSDVPFWFFSKPNPIKNDAFEVEMMKIPYDHVF